jgi:hypothetical protein
MSANSIHSSIYPSIHPSIPKPPNSSFLHTSIAANLQQLVLVLVRHYAYQRLLADPMARLSSSKPKASASKTAHATSSTAKSSRSTASEAAADPEYEIHRLLVQARNEDGVEMIEVKWVGYSETTWVPIAQLRKDVPHKVEAWLKDPRYLAEEIVDEANDQYKVKWVGYNETTWMSAKMFAKDAPRLVKAWKKVGFMLFCRSWPS